MNTAIAKEKTVRVIWKCRRTSCKHTWAYDYRIDEIGQKIRSTENGERGLRQDYSTLNCPKCNCTLPKGNEVRGRYSEKHKCNAKCATATGDNCDCQCAGRMHGSAYLV